MKTDIRIKEIIPAFEEQKLRSPLKFGSGVIHSLTSLTVRTTVETRNGSIGTGFGSILLSDVWSFPSIYLSHKTRDEALRRIALKASSFLSQCNEFLHPIDFFLLLENQIDSISRDVQKDMELNEDIPRLASLVAFSPFDAAIHDAFGKANNICSYDGYGPAFMKHDLSYYMRMSHGNGTNQKNGICSNNSGLNNNSGLSNNSSLSNAAFKGRYLSDYIHKTYSSKLSVFHLVGGMDKLTANEKDSGEINDGYPVSLDEWISKDGVFCFKIKLTGKDINYDVQRTKDCASVISQALALKNKYEYYLTTDSNEMNESPESVVEYLMKLKERCPSAYKALLYVEQPTERDISKSRYDMRKVAALKPVIADEGITDTEKVDLIKELGWSGIALKICKCHSAALLCAAKAKEYGMVYSVQDLTNVGYGLLQSAGFAARLNVIKGVEYNSRQYIPHAYPEIKNKYPGIFNVNNGYIYTGGLTGIGLY